MTTISYGTARRVRAHERRLAEDRPLTPPDPIGTSKARPRAKRAGHLPTGQTLPLARQIRQHYRVFAEYQHQKPFGYERAQRALDAIAALCVPHGRLIRALKGDRMAVSWAANLRQACYAASYDMPVPGRQPRARQDGDIVVHVTLNPETPQQLCQKYASTRREGAETLYHAIEDLLEFTRDRFHRM